MKITAYKALLAQGAGKPLVSAGVYGLYETKYTPGKETQGKNLFIFRELSDARAFALDINAVFEVLVDEEDFRKTPEKVLHVEFVGTYFEDFWADPQQFALDNPTFMQDTPQGSYNCNSLLVMERVH